MQEILTSTKAQEDFWHDNGEISKDRIEAIGLGMRRVRLANLPPEVADRTLKMVLGAYGEIRDIPAETWSNAYGSPVTNGIRKNNLVLSSAVAVGRPLLCLNRRLCDFFPKEKVSDNYVNFKT
jgi:hypothetical protein